MCRRVERRCRGLGLPDLAAYRDYLEERPGEWAALDGLCRVTISHFCRDRGAFAFLDQEVLLAVSPRFCQMRLMEGESVCATVDR